MSQAILSRLARRLARSIADAADADQWAMAVVGIENQSAPDFEEWVSRAWLEALNDGAPARYRITLVLQTPERDLGLVRLGTIQPYGFSLEQVTAAQAAADHAASVLSRALEEHAVPEADG
jgi:hypothetical protein